jgi:hypothetical protein
MKMEKDEMKATLEYNLPEEERELKKAIRATDYLIALWDITQDMRTHIKYGGACQLDTKYIEEDFDSVLKEKLENYLSPAVLTEVRDALVEKLKQSESLLYLDDYRSHLFSNVIDPSILDDLE